MTLISFKPALPDGSRRREDKSREKIFLKHYAWLFECAMNFTHGQRERAEDLVHDVFLEFLDFEADLTSIVDIRGYLNGILRNLHLLQLRQSTRHPMQSLSLFDYDSAWMGLRALTSVEQFQSADLLVRACDFVCHRKEATRSASIMILRFFHGYYPGEICQLLKAKRNMVDKWIERGRTEAKEYLESPYPLPSSRVAECKWPSPATSNVFLSQLRLRIFQSCTTGCSVLIEVSDDLNAQELAHLVSCRPCLERRSRKAGLSHVAERLADDISDRDDGSSQGGSGGTRENVPPRRRVKPPRSGLLQRVDERRKERFEHRPKEISLVFDGQVHATLLVNGPTNKLNLSLDSKEVPGSIAVLSEQDVRFMILSRDQLISAERQTFRLPLSDDRILQVTVTPETFGPSIQVVYEDPLFLSAIAGAEETEPLTIATGKQIIDISSRRVASVTVSIPEWRLGLFEKFRNLISAMNPLLAGAILFGFASVLCLLFWVRRAPSPTAAELLRRAQRAELDAVPTNRPGVICQKVAIRTLRRSVERTIYRDAQGIRRPRHQKLPADEERLKNRLERAGVNWDAPLSAVDYGEWRNHLGGTRDEVTRAGQHLLTLTTVPLNNSAVLRETLTIRDTDFHTVDRTLELRDTGTIEIAELNYDVLPWSAVNQDWFEPIAGDSSIPGRLHPSLLPHLPRLLSAPELDEAELSALLVLNQLHADQGEQLEVTRNGDGVLVRGLVETTERKKEIESRLIRVQHVTPLVFTIDEMARRQMSSDETTSIKTASTIRQPSPLEIYLLPQKKSREEISQLEQHLMEAALTTSRNSKETSDLLRQFSVHAEDLSPRARFTLIDLLENHKKLIEDALDREEEVLRGAGLIKSGPPTASRPDQTLNNLSARATENLELCRELGSTGDAEVRPVEAIIPELVTAITHLHSIARSVSVDPDLTNAASERPAANKN